MPAPAPPETLSGSYHTLPGSSHLLLSSGEVERREDDLPAKVDGVPELRVVHPERYHILPRLLHMRRVRGEPAEVAALRLHNVMLVSRRMSEIGETPTKHRVDLRLRVDRDIVSSPDRVVRSFTVVVRAEECIQARDALHALNVRVNNRTTEEVEVDVVLSTNARMSAFG